MKIAIPVATPVLLALAVASLTALGCNPHGSSTRAESQGGGAPAPSPTPPVDGPRPGDVGPPPAMTTDDGGSAVPTSGAAIVTPASGGAVTLQNFTVDVPPGAVSTSLTVDVKMAAAPAGSSLVEALSPTYELGPSGTQFFAPVRLVFRGLDEAKLSSGNVYVRLESDDPEEDTIALQVTHTGLGQVEAATMHFSKATVVRPTTIAMSIADKSIDGLLPIHSQVGCSTLWLHELSQQVLQVMLASKGGDPSLLTQVTHPKLRSTDDAVFPWLQPNVATALLGVLDDPTNAKLSPLYLEAVWRSLPAQYAIEHNAKCGNTKAAVGGSNHGAGLALDIASSYALKKAGCLKAGGVAAGNESWWVGALSGSFDWWGAKDDGTACNDLPHFVSKVEPAGPDVRGAGIIAFKKLWNRNNPCWHLDETATVDARTLSALGTSPPWGFSNIASDIQLPASFAGCPVKTDVCCPAVGQGAPECVAPKVGESLGETCATVVSGSVTWEITPIEECGWSGSRRVDIVQTPITLLSGLSPPTKTTRFQVDFLAGAITVDSAYKQPGKGAYSFSATGLTTCGTTRTETFDKASLQQCCFNPLAIGQLGIEFDDLSYEVTNGIIRTSIDWKNVDSSGTYGGVYLDGWPLAGHAYPAPAVDGSILPLTITGSITFGPLTMYGGSEKVVTTNLTVARRP